LALVGEEGSYSSPLIACLPETDPSKFICCAPQKFDPTSRSNFFEPVFMGQSVVKPETLIGWVVIAAACRVLYVFVLD
jgi:hypothetical protein